MIGANEFLSVTGDCVIIGLSSKTASQESQRTTSTHITQHHFHDHDDVKRFGIKCSSDKNAPKEIIIEILSI